MVKLLLPHVKWEKSIRNNKWNHMIPVNYQTSVLSLQTGSHQLTACSKLTQTGFVSESSFTKAKPKLCCTIFLDVPIWTFIPVSGKFSSVWRWSRWPVGVSISQWTSPLNWLIMAHSVIIREVSLEGHTLRWIPRGFYLLGMAQWSTTQQINCFGI